MRAALCSLSLMLRGTTTIAARTGVVTGNGRRNAPGSCGLCEGGGCEIRIGVDYGNAPAFAPPAGRALPAVQLAGRL